MQIDSNQSLYVLQTLLAERKIRAGQVREILRKREREIALLRRRPEMLEKIGGRPAPKGARGGAAAVSRRKLSPKVLALRRLQGRYMGHVRRLDAAKKARVRAVRERKGLAAAIRLAAALGRT